MPAHIFFVALIYVVLLIAIFIAYSSSRSFRLALPATIGQLPLGVVWFGAVGAEVASLYGIFLHNQEWDPSYNYWHYARPLFGTITGSIGALIYLVLLDLGSTKSISVNHTTFYAVAFILGFADKSFMQLLQNLTEVIIKPGNRNP